jgi:ATP-dependent RNA helicase RhlE
LKFDDFKFSKDLLEGLKALRFEEPTPIQEQAIPSILEGKDLIGAAQTGTGKTGAFVIPLLQKLMNDKDEGIRALILSPTRELASQIDEQIFAIGYHTGISSATVIGGSDFSEQAKAIRAGVDILVATPGRLIDQMKVMAPDLSNLKYLVLDEADRMLDMGFLPDVTKIIEQLPKQRQTLLFSATMPDEIQELSKRFMKDPVKVKIKVSKPSDQVEQRIYNIHPKKKLDLVEQIMEEEEWESVIIFTRTKRGTDQLYRRLRKRGIDAVHMHGDKDQQEREAALLKFKNGEYPVMVATDVLSRGIDIDNVSIIINYDVPHNADDYIHRIGRTGRYDKSGLAITLATRSENRQMSAIKDVVGDQLSFIDAKIGQSNSKKSDKRSSGDQKQRRQRSDRSSSKGKDSSDQQDQKSSSDEGSKQNKRKNKRRSGAQKSNQRRNKRDNSSKKGKDKNQRDGKYKQRKKASRDKKKGRNKNQQKSKENKRRSDRNNNDGRNNNRGKRNKGQDRGKNQSRSARRRRRQKIERRVQSEHPREELPVIEKAVQRNKHTRKPAKGVWGIIKSFIPKLGK